MRTAMAAMILAAATPAMARDDPVWAVTIEGGGLIADRGGGQSYAGVGVTRDVGEAITLGLAGSYTDSRERGGPLALPSKTYQARLSAEAVVGAVSIDGYASYGRRTFSSAAYARRNGSMLNLTGGGPVVGAGAGLSYDAEVAPRLYVSPQASLAYDRADIARVVVGAGGSRSIKDRQSGVTGTLGVAVQRLLDVGGGSGIALSATLATSSNAAAYRAASGLAPIATALGGKRADSWAELGGTGTVALNRRTALNLSALRTIGFADDDGVTLTAGVRVAF